MLRIRKPLIILTVVCLAGIPGIMSLHADAIVTKSGNVFLGKIQSSTADSIGISAYGKTETVSVSEIETNSPTVTPLKGKKLFFTLTDGSTLHGKLRDFSEEVGTYVDSEIGGITIPYSKISQIQTLKPEESGSLPSSSAPATTARSLSLLVGAFGSASYPFISDTMKQGFGGGAYAEVSVPWRYASGIGVAGKFETITAEQRALRFSETGIYAYARKSVFPFAGFAGSSLRKLAFALTVGIGGGYIHLADSRSGALSPNGEAYGLAVLKAGAEFPLGRALAIRFDLINKFRFISGENLWKPGIELGAVYAF